MTKIEISDGLLTFDEATVTHASINYDELIEIVQFIERNNEKELSIIDFVLKIPLITKWKELTIEQNLYFLENVKILEIERIKDFPIRKYKFKINIENFNSFKKLTDRTFELECDYSIEQYCLFFDEISRKVTLDYKDELIKEWRNTIINQYSRSEQKNALIQKRNILIEQYNSEKQPLRFYDISNFGALAEAIKTAVLHREKLPLTLNANIILNNFRSPIEKLRATLEDKFHAKLQIDTLNDLIESQEINILAESLNIKDVEEKKVNSKSVIDMPHHILITFSIYKKEYEKTEDQQKALTKTANEVEKNKERTFFTSNELDENKRHKNIKDSIRREFLKYDLINKKRL